MVDELPEENIFEELQYRLYVMREVQKGLQSIDEGRDIPHEDVL